MGRRLAAGNAIRGADSDGQRLYRSYALLSQNGDEVTKEAYEAARKRYRGDIVQEKVRDATWSTWSQPHRFSGQSFQSPSPRRYLRTRIRLYSDDLDASPVLRSLRVVANDPVIIAGLSARCGRAKPGSIR